MCLAFLRVGTVSVAGFEAARATEKAGVAEEEGAQETGDPASGHVLMSPVQDSAWLG